jgi:hypothetical protein
MLQAHSFLWHYLWVAPSFLLLVLAALLWRRGVHKQFPVFFLFSVVIAIEQLILYAADVVPSVRPTTWWYLFWAGLLVEALLRFSLVGEIFGAVFGRYRSLARIGKLLISGVGVVLVLLASVIAAYTPKDNIYWIVSGAHVLQQTIYMIECGLVSSLFVFASFFKLTWGRSAFGIAIGLGLSACVHLATWALLANGNLSARYRVPLDFLNMGMDHLCVLIWFYYLLVPAHNSENRPANTFDPFPPARDLETLNQELERLIHQ